MFERHQFADLLQLTALFSKPHYILLGGICTGLGVVATHALGTRAQDIPCELNGNMPVLISAALFSCISTTVAFWIIFRVLTFWPKHTALFYGSVLLMGSAICGTQYCGFLGVSYYFSPHALYKDGLFEMQPILASQISTQGCIMCCYVLYSTMVMRISSASRMSEASRTSSRTASLTDLQNPSPPLLRRSTNELATYEQT